MQVGRVLSCVLFAATCVGALTYIASISAESLWKVGVSMSPASAHGASGTGSVAGLGSPNSYREWIDFYNTERPDSALDGQTPAAADIPTGTTAATRCEKQDFGGMIRQRNTA